MGNRGSDVRRRQLKHRLEQVETSCWLCGFPLVPNAEPFTDLYTEIDEETPVSKGGDPYGVSSPCHLTHRCCNLHKNNKKLEQGSLHDWFLERFRLQQNQEAEPSQDWL